MSVGQVYRCVNRECGREVRLDTVPAEHGPNPKCSCGAAMKKPYNKPILRSIDSRDVLIASDTALEGYPRRRF
jgi:hypothetical protein